ncbi:MAG: type II toxin-antitoxin system Phd/YefM family antitoxin [Candidatus Omnitrophica bacterium]|nr:type II toxin-antitoxin system Phd/YefM family antitoxin [Candidatus Omnitrophota bacterium]
MIKPSQLRENVYNLLDRVIETGVPLEINRKGKVLRVTVDKKASKLSNLKKRKVMSASPDFYVHLDWSKKWLYNG